MKISKSRLSLSILLLLLVYSFSGCTELLGTFEYVGEKDPVTIPKSTHTTVIFDFQFLIGSIDLEIIPNATYLVDVVTRVGVREGSGGTLEDAQGVNTSEIDSETMKVTFSSNDNDYKYDHFIKISGSLLLTIDFIITTGDIKLHLADASSEISSLNLQSTTGSIDLTLLNLGFSDTSPTVELTTGNLDLTLTDLLYEDSTVWLISTTTGNIDLDLTDSFPFSNTTITHQFDISCTTGGLAVLSRFHETIGLKIAADVTTGSITIPGGSSSYSSTNFASSTVKYDFDLSTVTGDITYSTSG
jgi:hypothetical protein